MNYPNQFTPMAETATNARPMYPGHFDEWQVRTAVLAKDVIPTIYELISADAADDELLRIVSGSR